MKPRQDRHAIKLRHLALMIVQAHGASYRDDYLVIEYRAGGRRAARARHLAAR
jgi:hypothetical protein